uniref:Uncharacterized protein n=1 Tax=Anopheles merus TaxID=30066 RepID=A0A182VA02_ANOME
MNTITPVSARKRLCQTPRNSSNPSASRFCFGSSRNVWSNPPHEIRNSTACTPSNACIHLLRWCRCPPTSNMRNSCVPPPSEPGMRTLNRTSCIPVVVLRQFRMSPFVGMYPGIEIFSTRSRKLEKKSVGDASPLHTGIRPETSYAPDVLGREIPGRLGTHPEDVLRAPLIGDRVELQLEQYDLPHQLVDRLVMRICLMMVVLPDSPAPSSSTLTGSRYSLRIWTTSLEDCFFRACSSCDGRRKQSISSMTGQPIEHDDFRIRPYGPTVADGVLGGGKRLLAGCDCRYDPTVGSGAYGTMSESSSVLSYERVSCMAGGI